MAIIQTAVEGTTTDHQLCARHSARPVTTFPTPPGGGCNVPIPTYANEGPRDPPPELPNRSLGLPGATLHHSAVHRHGQMAAVGFGETTLRFQIDGYKGRTG